MACNEMARAKEALNGQPYNRSGFRVGKMDCVDEDHSLVPVEEIEQGESCQSRLLDGYTFVGGHEFLHAAGHMDSHPIVAENGVPEAENEH